MVPPSIFPLAAKREGIENLSILHEKNPPSNVVTTSIGVKVVTTSDECDMKKLYNIADKALYMAKETGRNRIVVAEDKTLEDII